MCIVVCIFLSCAFIIGECDPVDVNGFGVF